MWRARTVAVLVAQLTCAGWLTTGQASQRGLPASATAGLSGVVDTTRSGTAEPVSGARVELRCENVAIPQVVVTDGQGAFAFSIRAPARCVLSASDPGYLTTAFGAKRVGGQGTPISLTRDGATSRVVITLLPGSVITGTVTDEDGDAVAGTLVVASTYAWVNGVKALQAVPGLPVAAVDDRGVYRIFGLAPGRYAVSALPSRAAGENVPQVSQADIDAVLARAGGVAPPPARVSRGAGGVEPLGPPGASRTSGRVVGYVPTYFPGTIDPSNATLLDVGLGAECDGVDFRLQRVPTARLSGTLIAPTQAPISALDVSLIVKGPWAAGPPVVRASAPDGRFSIGGLAPGRYVLTARADVHSPAAGGAVPAAAQGGPWWAVAGISISGPDVDSGHLALRPGASVSGRVTIADADAGRPGNALRGPLVVEATPADAAVAHAFGSERTEVRPDGTFKLAGLAPGEYWLDVRGVAPAGAGDPIVVLTTGELGTTSVVEHPVPLQPEQDVAGVHLTVATSAAVSGVLVDAVGRPASNVYLIVFPSDHSAWLPGSPRIREFRAGTDGRYRFGGLAAGEYWLAAVDDLEVDEWFDPEFLGQLVPAAVSVILKPGDVRKLDLVVRQPPANRVR
jgi:hypothetical protein